MYVCVSVRVCVCERERERVCLRMCSKQWTNSVYMCEKRRAYGRNERDRRRGSVLGVKCEAVFVVAVKVN